MRDASVLTLAIALVACTSTEPPPDEDTEVKNYDQQIDGRDGLEPPDTLDAEDLHMCVGDAGRVFVVWLDTRDGFADVWMNRSDDGITFLEEPIRVKQGVGNASRVDMACDGDRVFVTWEDDRDGTSGYENIYMNRSLDGGDTWLEDDLAVDDDPDGIFVAVGPEIAVQGDDVHIVWYDQREGAPDIFMATSTDGGASFGPLLQMSSRRQGDPPEFWSGNPQIALDSAGQAYVVWEDTRSGNHDLFFATADRTGVVATEQVRIDVGDEPGAGFSFFPRLGVGEGGHVYVTWHDTRGGEGRDVFVNYSADGGDTWFDEAIRIEGDPPGFSDSLRPELLVDGATAHIVWQDQRNVGFDIYYRQLEAGVPVDASLEVDVRIDQDVPGSGNSISPVLAMGDDQLIIAWSDLRWDTGEGFNDLYYNVAPLADTDMGWLEEELRLDSMPPGISFTEELQLAVHDGHVYAAWLDGRNGTRDVYFSRNAIGVGVDVNEEYTVEGSESDDTDAPEATEG
jgi:hypothetical protein